MKTCTICAKTKPVAAFEPQRCQCRDCRKVEGKERRARYYARNRGDALLKTREWREKNIDKQRAARKQEYALNAESAKQAAQEYRKNHPEKINAWSRKHQLAKRNRTPCWLTMDDFWLMEQAYELAVLRTKLFGFSWQVDHILPLQGKLVSGLHVPDNLRVIPSSENRSKSNRYEVA